MFISRPSDPRTVLLWGDQWWFAGTTTPLGFTDLTQAAEALAQHYADEPKPIRLRLVYQPEAFRSVRTTCPMGDRRLLSAALGAEFPALTQSDRAWSHEHILPLHEGYSTLLHFEETPALFALATQLAELGLAVESAWPLATFLHELPAEWTESGAMTVVALHADRALAHRHPATGPAEVRRWDGDGTIAEVSQWLGSLLAENAEEPILLVPADHEAAASLESFIRLADYAALEQLQLPQALGQRVVLPRYHPAQLLPREAIVTRQRALIAAGIALLLTAAGIGGTAIQSVMAARSEHTMVQARTANLRMELVRLRENASAIADLRSLIEAGSGSPPFSAILDKIGRSIPPVIALDELRLSARRISLEGWIAPSAPPTTAEHWRTALNSSGGRWAVDTQLRPGGAVSMSGDFKP